MARSTRNRSTRYDFTKQVAFHGTNKLREVTGLDRGLLCGRPFKGVWNDGVPRVITVSQNLSILDFKCPRAVGRYVV